MADSDFYTVVRDICRQDERYDEEAYAFIREALDFTAKKLSKPTSDVPERHVTGRQLLDGIRDHALQEFGPVALTVLKTWGITSTEDVGEIVFNLVNAGVLRRTETDTKADFAAGYDFEDAFAAPFRPRNPLPEPL